MSKILSKGLTFDDVLLVPAYSEVTPDVVDVTAWLTPSISLNIPLVSAAMDTVTESAMAISMARAGGIGIVHKNMSIERQKLEIEKVKKSESGMIIDPITVEPDDTVEHALDLMHAYRVSGLPVVREKKLVGILTNRDVRFVEDLAGTKVRDVMTSENLITVPTGTTLSKILSKGLTFDDVLLVPAYSEVTPDVVDVTAWLTPSISLNIPLVSAAMDTVTESAMAISMARAGGIGIVHKNMSIERQKLEIEKVKKSESGMIIDPITVEPDDTVEHALDLMHAYRVSGLPVVREKKLVGILTNRDVRFVEDLAGTKVRDVMTSENLITVPTGTTLEEAKHHLHTHRIEKLLVVDEKGELAGLLTMKDIDKVQKYPNACKDSKGRLRVGAAIGVGPEGEKRAAALIAAGVDVLVLDSAHGHSKNILDAVSAIKGAFPDCQLVAGNVATYEGARAMLKAGADTVKVGIGPGSICTTRVVAGVGVPQVTAIMECSRAAREMDRCCIGDGGIKFSGDVVKALSAGANSVMVGSLLAGTEESPGETILYQGRTYKIYRGMGSIDAMKEGSSDRYFQQKSKKLVPEGIVGRVPFRGLASETIYQLVGGVRSGMGYCGAATIQELFEKSQMVEISAAGLRESHVHDVIITKEAPNYRVDNA